MNMPVMDTSRSLRASKKAMPFDSVKPVASIATTESVAPTESAAPVEPPEHAVAAVYDRHIDTVYRVCFAMMGNAPDAEDAVQSVFVKLMEYGKPFRDAEHEKAWLITVARNHCRDVLRKWWRKKSVSTEVFPLELVAARRPDHGGFAALVGKLPRETRLLLYLYYYEGYKLAEIAAMLKANPNTVKARLRSARKRLKLEMGEDRCE